MRFAIVGAGVIGTIHAKLIDSFPDDEASLAAVVDTDADRARELAAPYGAVAHTELDAVLTDPDVDAVAICVPSGIHPELALRAIAAGKAVLIEKPIGIEIAGARAIEAAAADGPLVGVVSQRRFQPPARFIRDTIDAGHLGTVTSAVVESPFFRSQAYYDSGDWRGTLAMDGGGALMNQGIHALDLMIWMLGEPVLVSAHTGLVAHAGIEVEDVVGATITFASGAIGVMLATTAANPGLPVRLAVHGSEGVVIMDDERITRFVTTVEPTPAVEVPTEPEPVPEGWNAADVPHRAQYADFIDAARTGRPPLITPADGCRTLSVVLAVYASARLGRAVPLTDQEITR